MRHNEKRTIFVLLILAMVFSVFSGCASSAEADKPTVRIAIPYEEQLFGINNEYYKSWLEKESGLKIEFSFIPQSYTQEYLRMLLSGEHSEVDAVFFSQDSVLTVQELAEYGKAGRIAALETMIDASGIYLPKAFEQHSPYDLRQAITEPDGHIYYMPSLHASASTENFQTLWLNVEQLEKLGLTIPATTDDFEQVLRAFVQYNPDGAPLIGSVGSESNFVCNFLMNSFTVCDPSNGYMAIENGKVVFTPVTAEWRDGLRYCHKLYNEGLLPAQNFTYNTQEFVSFCNDPRNLAGAFTAKRLSDVLSEQSPQLLSRYLAVPPLTGPQRAGVAIIETPMPRPGGVILASSPRQKEVFALMDLMCSKDAFLIGHYGEPGVDWAESQVGDITIHGEPATITIKNTDRLRRDKTLGVVGPFIAQPEYADNVAWKGYQVNQSEYLEARAFRVYQPYAPIEYIRTILFTTDVPEKEQRLQNISAYTKAWMIDFITGKQDIEDDAVWQEYLDCFFPYDLDGMVAAVQRSYDRMEE